MTDTTREGAEQTLNSMSYEVVYGEMDRRLAERIGKQMRALLTRAEAAEARAYTLAVAIMGGEDAPGYADSIDTGILADQLRKERADQSAWIDACVKVGREAAEAERDALAAKLALAVEALDEMTAICAACTFDTIRLRGQYVDRKEAVERARATLAQLTADTPKEES